MGYALLSVLAAFCFPGLAFSRTPLAPAFWAFSMFLLQSVPGILFEADKESENENPSSLSELPCFLLEEDFGPAMGLSLMVFICKYDVYAMNMQAPG